MAIGHLANTVVVSGATASQNFDSDISHLTNSSSRVPVCTVELARYFDTPTDVGIIVNCSFCAARTLTVLQPADGLPTSTATA